MAIMLISAPATLEGKSDSLRVIFVAFLLGNCNAQNNSEHTKVHIKCLCSNRNHKSKLTHFKNKTVAATNPPPPPHSLTWRDLHPLGVCFQSHCWRNVDIVGVDVDGSHRATVTCLPCTEFGNDNLVCNGPSWVTRDSTTNHSYHDIVAWPACQKPGRAH